MGEVDWVDVEELVRAAFKLDEDTSVEDFLASKDIDFDSFHKTVEILLPMIVVYKGLSGQKFKGFGKGCVCYIKMAVEET